MTVIDPLKQPVPPAAAPAPERPSERGEALRSGGNLHRSPADALEAQGAERLRQTLQIQHMQEARVQSEAEQKLALLDADYQVSVDRSAHAYARRLREQQNQEELRLQANRQRNEAYLYQQKEASAREQSRLNQDHELLIRDLQEETNRDLQQRRANAQEAQNQSALTTRAAVEVYRLEQAKLLQMVQDDLRARVRSVQQQATQTLQNYETQSLDPFYRLQQFAAQLTQTNSDYVLQVAISPFEADSVSIQIHDDELLLRGERRSEQKDANSSSQSFQSMRQRFTLDHPVRAHAVHRTYDGHNLVFVIPKIIPRTT